MIDPAIITTILQGGVPLLLGIAVVVLWRKNQTLEEQIREMYSSSAQMESRVMILGNRVEVMTGKLDAYTAFAQSFTTSDRDNRPTRYDQPK